MSKLRTCNLRIPNETDIWANIPRQERICTFVTKLLATYFIYVLCVIIYIGQF